MDQSFLTSLPLWVLNLSLGGLVWLREPRNASHQTFAVYVLTMVMWSVCVKMAYANATASSGIFWVRLTFFTAGFIGHSFVIFCHAFPDRRRVHMSLGTWWVILLGSITPALAFTPLLVRDISLSRAGDLQLHYGPLYRLFGIFILMAFGHGLWTLSRKWRASRGRSRQQIRYLLIGLGLTIAGGTTTNLIIPALTGSSRFSAYGPYFTLFFIGLTAQAMIRHRLLDVRLVIRQSVTYGLSLAITVCTIWGILTGMQAVLGALHVSTLALGVGVGGVVVFHPLRVALQRLLDRYCYREPDEYRQATRSMSQVLAELVRLAPLGDYLATFILNTLKVEAVAVYVRTEAAELEHCASRRVGDEGYFPRTLSIAEMMTFMPRARQPIVRDELGSVVDNEEKQRLVEILQALQSDVIVPLLVEGQIAALITVGGKLSGDPFFTRDLELLSTVGHQASVALRRAQLYEEISVMKEYSESILRQMQSGVIAVNHKGLITMINTAAARLIQVEVVEVTGSSVTKVLPEALHGPLVHTLVESKAYTNQEATLHLASGRVLPIAISTSVLHGSEGASTGAILVFHDFSRLKELEEEKLRVERLASIGAFVSGIAHEIKNPLVAIKTFAELLPEQYDDDEFRETFTQVALHEVERIDTLVQRLRSMGVSSRAKRHPISILTPLDETLALISGELIKHRIALVYDKQPEVPPVMGDHDQLKQVFLNLCLNSIEAMEADGTLRITLDVEHTHDETPSMLVIRIADTGPGIPEAYFPTIFEPFVTSKDTGSGLGLAICKGIIEYHRGTIDAANHPDGIGAMFTLRLPIAQEEDVYEVAAPHCRPAANHAVA